MNFGFAESFSGANRKARIEIHADDFHRTDDLNVVGTGLEQAAASNTQVRFPKQHNLLETIKVFIGRAGLLVKEKSVLLACHHLDGLNQAVPEKPTI